MEIWHVCWCKLIHRRLLFSSDGLSFCFEKVMQEDMLFCMLLYLRTSSIVYVDKSLYYYLDRADSLSKKKLILGFIGRCRSCGAFGNPLQ